VLSAPPALQVLPAPPGINHGAGLAWLGGRGLLACWYSGRSEAGPDAVILCARSHDLGDHWAAPMTVSIPHERALGGGAPAKSVGNVVLAKDATGRLVMVAGEIQSRRVLGFETCRTWRCGRIDFRVSTDDGASWSPPTRLDDRRGALPRSGPRHVDGQGDLLPVYQEAGRAWVLRLDLAQLKPGVTPAVQAMAIPARGPLIQPSLVALPGGHVLALLRDPHRRFVHVSAFDPATETWSQARPTSLENPGSAVEAFLDGRGRVVLIHNPGRTSRRTLSFAFSIDGVAFSPGCDLVARDAVGEAAYPSVAPLGPGAWGVAFSIEAKRRIAFARFDQAFLDACAEA
jgi:hypothetical protein